MALVTLALWPFAHAEYRVHLLEIRDVDSGATRQVASTLDHFQYPEYYPVRKREVVILLDHWMCYGRTSDHQPLCPSPRPPEPLPEELPATPAPPLQ